MADEIPQTGFLRLTPAGRLRALESGAAALSPELGAALEAFKAGEEEGLFSLAAIPASGRLPGELAFWRDFSSRCLTERCRMPATAAELDPIAGLSESDIARFLADLPPMEGAEYLCADTLRRMWLSLDGWLRSEALASGGFEPFLAARAPAWRHVGRVCFHLAENRKDSEYPFAFLVTYAPRMAESSQVRYQPLAKALQEFAGLGNRAALVKLLGPIHDAAQKSPAIRDLLDSGDIYHPLAWTVDDAYRFLKEIPLYEESGVLVRVPDWWARRPRPRVGVSIGSRAKGILGRAALLDFDVAVFLGDESMTEEEVREILASGEGLRFLRGKWVEVDPERLSEALAHWKKIQKKIGKDGISFVEGMRLLAGASADLGSDVPEAIRAWSFVDSGSWLKDTLSHLRSPESMEAEIPGEELRATLRHYQKSGLSWLSLLAGLGLGACLADDMGLGKTIQVLALLLLVKKNATRSVEGSPRGNPPPSLLVLPASLLANWKSEAERFAPSLRLSFVHPSMANPGGLAASASDVATFDLVATSYGMLLRQSWIQESDWNLVIIDEAQAIKNPGSKQARAVKKLRARSRIALTGTPVENRLGDLWSIFDFLNPGLLGSTTRFREFTSLLEKREGERYAPLRNLVSPYILRRLKTDRSVIADLPDKTEIRAFCGLSKTQTALYASIVDNLRESLRESPGIARKGIILATLMKLKQVCNHPAQYRGDEDWAPGESGKFSRIAQLCEEIASRQDKVLVFTQFREMTRPLAEHLAGIFGREGLVLHGGTPVAARLKLVDAFQDDGGPPFFVLSLKAGGTGLNLTAASHVIHFDRWWNPAVENQATDRAFRIGQKKNVLVHKFLCRGTIEEKIDELIGSKSALAGDLLGSGTEAILTGMSDDQLLSTVRLDLDRAQSGI